jgi:hypothetical protein
MVDSVSLRRGLNGREYFCEEKRGRENKAGLSRSLLAEDP